MAHVLILGGGFGGLAAAHELRARLGESDRITLVDRGDRFYMGFAKLWDLAGMRPLAEGTASLTRLADHGVDFLQRDIVNIDPEARAVETSGGRIEADALLVALGAGAARGSLAHLRGDNAFDLYDAAELPGMHRALQSVETGRVVVAILGGPFKCPPAPYEGALIVDEILRARKVRGAVAVAVATFQPMTLPVAGPDASRFVAGHLQERGIELLSGKTVREVDASGRVLHFEDGTQLGYTVLLGVPASAPPPVVADSPLAGKGGWIEPDRATMRTGFDRVYAVGDCTVIPTAKGQLPKAGVMAAAEGRVAAANIAADLTGGEGATFDGRGYCFLELPGRRVAVVEGDFLSDPPDVHISEADEQHFRAKQEFERSQVAAWLG